MHDDALREGLGRYLEPEQLTKLASVRVGIAGAGGLGSNVAMFLARSGIEKMLLADGDVVEPSNLNRQHYWPQDLGLKKIHALKKRLLALNSHMDIEAHDLYLDRNNLGRLIPECPIWVEALDSPDSKAQLVEEALLHGAWVIAASGICGIGGPPLGQRQIGRLTMIGDFRTDVCAAPPMAPRVSQAAAMMADRVLDLLLNADL